MEPIDLNALDTTVHGPIRLGVLSSLHIDGSLDFTALKKRLNAADGSLGMHLQKLEDANYITSKKRLIGRRPNTTYRMTSAGKKALVGYLQKMQELINAVGC